MANDAETTTKLVAVLKSLSERLEGIETAVHTHDKALASLLREMPAHEPSPPSEEMTPDEEWEALQQAHPEMSLEERLITALRAVIPEAKVVPTKAPIGSFDWTPMPARPKEFASPKAKRAWWTARNAEIRADIRLLREEPGNLIGKRGKPVVNLPEEIHKRLGAKHGCGFKNTHMREAEVRKGKTD